MPFQNKDKINLNKAYYHAYNRGFERRKIFHTNDDYEVFLDLIKRSLKKYNHIELRAFCLMPNHYHMLIAQLKKSEMGKFFQYLNPAYSRYYNFKYKKTGQLWQGTYRATLITSAAHYGHELHYIHYNPKNIVERPENYLYSSLSDYVNKTYNKLIKKGCPSEKGFYQV